MIRLFSILLVAASSVGAASDWPEFRGPTMQGHSSARNVPVKWSATENVAWKVPMHSGWSSPVVSGGKVYVTGATNSSQGISLRVISLDLQNGRTLWDVEALHAAAAGPQHKKNGLASPTPILRDGRIYVHFGHLGAAALDLAGKVLWTQTSIKYSSVHGNGGTPALVGDVLVFGCDGASDPFLIALDARNGEIKWRTPRKSPAKSQFSFSTPLLINVDGVDLLISPTSGFVGAYNPKTGAELWRVGYGEGYSVIPRPIFANGLLYVSSGFDRPIIYAINPKGAKGDATDSAIIWSEPKGAPNTPSLLAAGTELYSVSDSGIATCYDAKTGAIQWSERLGGGFSASPVFAEGKIYFQNEEGIGYVVKAGRTFELLSKNELGDRTLASPALLDNTILIRSAGFLWKIGK